MKKFLLNHLQASVSSLGQLSRSPIATLFTFAVIGIALALPLGLSVVLKNIQTVSGSLQDSGQVSLYLKVGETEKQAQQLQQVVNRDQSVASSQYISPKEGLKEFSQTAGFGSILKNIKQNPLPGVILVKPLRTLHSWQVQQLVSRLKQLPGVAVAQLDMQWLKRLYAILSIGHRAAILLLIVFAFAVLLIIGNTIRLTTQSRRKEILVIKLIGGTNHFIRRPFLYSGMLYGLAGAIIAWLLVDFMEIFLQAPIAKLASLYGTTYQVQGLGTPTTLLLLIGGIALGWLASWLTVSRQIAKIDPDKVQNQ